MWIPADFECVNLPRDSANEINSMQNLFVTKPLAIGYKVAKNSEHDNLELEKERYNIFLGRLC